MPCMEASPLFICSFFFFYLLGSVITIQPQVILLGKYPSGALLGSAQSQLGNPLHSGKSIVYEFH